jgi:hypothetical protein
MHVTQVRRAALTMMALLIVATARAASAQSAEELAKQTQNPVAR